MTLEREYRMLICLCVCLVLFVTTAFAYEYKVENIPDSLRENAEAVVRDYSVVYTQYDTNNAVLKVRKVITVFNDKGNNHAVFFTVLDKFRELQKFEGILTNNSGQEIRKIKRKDLIESGFSEQMATDDINVLYQVVSPVYPYTVEYNYEIKYKNGIIGYPPFLPLSGLKQSAERAEYRIETPLNITPRFYTNFNCLRSEESTDKHKVYIFKANQIKAVKDEPLSPYLDEYMPVVKAGVSDFCYDNVCGNYTTWRNYGLWQSKLLKGRDLLSVDAVARIKDLVKDAGSDREKVGILYKYLQDNFRYISIQLGIGGFQPFPAETTFKNKFGDCKALSNLMMAMLKVAGISSNYAEIHMGRKKHLLEDFPDPSQTNHVILRVPLPNDTIWLECTSQTLPMGYVHSNIAGHDALIITDDGGVVERLPSYTSEQNLSESTITMNIGDDGTVKGQLQFNEHVDRFRSHYRTMQLNDRTRHMEYINGKVNLGRMEIEQIETSESLTDLPSCSLFADYVAKDYINISGQRMFISLMPLKKGSYSVFNSKERERDILVDHGFSDRDSIIVNIPEGYVIESKPRSVLLVSPFGLFKTDLKEGDGNSIVYTQYINIPAGRYDKSKYEEIKNFFKQINSLLKSRIVIRKDEA